MQIHLTDVSIIKGDIPVRLNSPDLAIITLDKISLFMTSTADCDELIKAAVEAKRLLLGEPVKPDLAAAEASPANSYGSVKHGEFGAPSAAAVAQDVEPAGPVFACTECDWHSIPGEYPMAGGCPRCGEGVVPCRCDETPPAPTGHLPQHTGCEPGCTYAGCTQHGTAVTR